MSILCWKKVYEYKKIFMACGIYLKYIKGNGTVLNFSFPQTYFLIFSRVIIQSLKNVNNLKTVRERDKWLINLDFIISCP